jgi:hypothetical protein
MRAIEPVIGKEPFRDFLREARGPSPEEPDLGEKLVELAKEFGVTHGIRTLLGSSSTGLSAPEIKTALQSGGWNADEYKNPLAFVHTVLKRLVEAGEVAELPAVEGTKRYRWAVGKPEATTAPGNGTGRVRREKKIGVVHRRP